MPGPFPGMDPYLESSPVWQGFHNALMTYIADSLQPQLPDRYVAILDIRTYLEPPDLHWPLAPNYLANLELARIGPSAPGRQPLTSEIEASPTYAGPLDPVEVREAFVDIKSWPAAELVTSIEILSPSNKVFGPGRTAYREKQRKVIEAGANFVEIDLLRRGAHTVLAPYRQVAQLPPFQYLASCYRADVAERFQVYSWSVRDPLPCITVPLAPGDPEVPLDLPRLFHRGCDNVRLHMLLDYAGEVNPPLVGEGRVWADALLRTAGLRGGMSA